MPITVRFKINFKIKYKTGEILWKHIPMPSGAAIKNQKIHSLTFQGLEFLSSETLKYILKVCRPSRQFELWAETET